MQNDLKKVLQLLPEGVMIYKKYDNPHIKLWNNELERMFEFQTFPKIYANNSTGSSYYENRAITIDDVDTDHLKDILSKKILVPIHKVNESE